jgi:hypothetical protein
VVAEAPISHTDLDRLAHASSAGRGSAGPSRSPSQSDFACPGHRTSQNPTSRDRNPTDIRRRRGIRSLSSYFVNGRFGFAGPQNG